MKIKKFLFLVAILTGSTQVFADCTNYGDGRAYCVGYIGSFQVFSNGDIVFGMQGPVASGMPCTWPTATAGRWLISPTDLSYKNWYAALLTGIAANRTIGVISTAESAGGICRVGHFQL